MKTKRFVSTLSLSTSFLCKRWTHRCSSAHILIHRLKHNRWLFLSIQLWWWMDLLNVTLRCNLYSSQAMRNLNFCCQFFETNQTKFLLALLPLFTHLFNVLSPLRDIEFNGPPYDTNKFAFSTIFFFSVSFFYSKGNIIRNTLRPKNIYCAPDLDVYNRLFVVVWGTWFDLFEFYRRSTLKNCSVILTSVITPKDNVKGSFILRLTETKKRSCVQTELEQLTV